MFIECWESLTKYLLFAGAMGMFGFDDDMEDNPFIDDAMFDDEGLLDDFDEGKRPSVRQ